MSSRLQAVAPANNLSRWKQAETGYVPLLTEVNATYYSAIGLACAGLGIAIKVDKCITGRKSSPELFLLPKDDELIELGMKMLEAHVPRMFILPAACYMAMQVWRQIYPS